jgi:FkbM family methyltransferase
MGLYPLQFAEWSAPNGVVHAFEPNPITADVLAEHLRLNGVADRVRVVRKAVGDRAGSLPFFATAVEGMSRLGSPNPQLEATAREIMVAVTTLDLYCRDHEVRPDVVMIDVEGFEELVLRGAVDMLTYRSPPAVVVEMHPNAWEAAGTDRSSFERFLKALGITAVPLNGQADPMADYGHVLLVQSRSTGR